MSDAIKLETRDELELFFADLQGYPQGSHRGIEFGITETLDPNPLTEPIHGNQYVVIKFPSSLGADLLLESRPSTLANSDEDLLNKYFLWSATSDEYLRRGLRGPFLDALVDLARHYVSVVVTDAWVGFGLLHGHPTDTARRFDALVRAILAHFWPSELPLFGADIAGAGDDSHEFFCFFCGETFNTDLALCPACGAELSE